VCSTLVDFILTVAAFHHPVLPRKATPTYIETPSSFLHCTFNYMCEEMLFPFRSGLWPKVFPPIVQTLIYDANELYTEYYIHALFIIIYIMVLILAPFRGSPLEGSRLPNSLRAHAYVSKQVSLLLTNYAHRIQNTSKRTRIPRHSTI
jgi:hypothetical protein